jgi:hypothetical protein
VLPLAGAALMAVGLLLAERRRRAVLIAGLALLAMTALLAFALLVGAAWAGAKDDNTVAGALVRHGWPIVVGPAWWSVLAVSVVGLLLSAGRMTRS